MGVGDNIKQFFEENNAAWRVTTLTSSSPRPETTDFRKGLRIVSCQWAMQYR